MPHLLEIDLSGPPPEEGDLRPMLDSLAAAVESERGGSHDEPDQILDYQVIGHPSGARVRVVLYGDDMERAWLAALTLAGYLTTWSPGLSGSRIERMSVAAVTKPDSEEESDWLPPPDEDAPIGHRPLAALLDEQTLPLAALHLVASAVRSLWNPVLGSVHPVATDEDVVAGAVEHPWDRELLDALGPLLVAAARRERVLGNGGGPPTGRGGGAPGLAEDLLRRARLISDTDPENDLVAGHDLLEEFVRAQGLEWLDGAAPDPRGWNGARRQREVVRAGLRALAALAHPLSAVPGPWALLSELIDDDVVTLLAAREGAMLEYSAAEDQADIRGAATAHAAIWLAVRRPDLLDTVPGRELVEAVAPGITQFGYIVNSALVEIGAGPLLRALLEVSAPPDTSEALAEFAQALATTESEEPAGMDVYEHMLRSLERALEPGEGMAGRIRSVLDVLSRAAALTATEANPHLDIPEQVSDPGELAAELLAEASDSAALVLAGDEDADEAVLMRALAAVAHVNSEAAGEMAADLPDLAGDDPRLEPAARERARHWLETALALSHEESLPSDAGELLDTASPRPVQEVVAIAARTTAALVGPSPEALEKAFLGNS